MFFIFKKKKNEYIKKQSENFKRCCINTGNRLELMSTISSTHIYRELYHHILPIANEERHNIISHTTLLNNRTLIYITIVKV